MKKLTLFLLIAALLLSLASCGFLKGSNEDASDDPAKKGKSDGASDGSVIVIGDTTITLNQESHHGDMYFMENPGEIEKAAYEQVCELYCRRDEGQLFVIHLVYFKGASVEEVMVGSDYPMTDKTVNGLEYKYFEYDENGTPGHAYVIHYEGTTYTISFVSSYDMTSLETVFMNNVYFKKG